MNRKLLAGLAGLVLVALAVWLFASRGDKSPTKNVEAKKPVSVDVKTPTAQKPADDQAAPKGMAPKWQLDIDPEGPLRLEGQVVDADGHGVGGAEVSLNSVPPRTAKTEDDGTFAFDKLVGREYALVARTADDVGGPIQYKLTESSDPIVIRLAAGATLVVTVSDDAGKPIEGADVKLASMTERVTKTSADGVAKIKPVTSGWASVQASAAGYAPNNAFTQLGGAGSTGNLKVTLHKGFAVTGRVIDEGGKPIEKAHITTSDVLGIPGGIDPVVTDSKGQFSIPALAPGSHILVATDEEHAPARSAPVSVGERPVTGVEITMRAGGVLAGSVVDDTGKPVPYATVRVGGSGMQDRYVIQSRQATTDKLGAFELKGLSRAKLSVRAEGDAAASAIATVDLTTELAKKDLKLVLDVKGTIAGNVVDESGQPVAEVQVNAFPDILAGEAPEALALAGLSSASTDGAGHFMIRGLPEGGYRVRASRASGSGEYDWGQQGVAAKTGDKNVKITLQSPGSIVGKVMIDGGTVPKLATVSLGFQTSTVVGADGKFKLDDLTPRKYDLKVHGPDFAETLQHDIEVKPGQPTDIGTITVQRGRRLTGRVVDDKGNAVAGARVKVGDMLYSMQGAEEQLDNWAEMSGGRVGVTDQDGRFSLLGLGKKRTSVIADHATRGRSNALEIAEGTEDPPPVTLAIHGYGSLTGKVTSQGKPVAGVTITDTPKGGGAQVQIARSEADGTFTLSKVTEGTHVLSAMQQGGFTSLKSASTTVQVTAGKATNVTIDIPVGSVTLSVVVKALPNNQVDAAQIFLFRGVLAVKNAKELNEGFLAGSVQGMKFWFGEGKPTPEFEELVAGTYSVCTIPITGDLNDATFQARIQEHLDALKVYCKSTKVTESPAKQTFIAEVPAMAPLPTNQ
ncbi:MAG: hypothetical protein HOV81_00815 [Kofleriaceae bacterium]|nr:hypothetical protein [Kofleriaceae bacterium]